MLILCILSSLHTYADHDCIDAREYGQKIIVDKSLPTLWFIIGDKQINDPNLHRILRAKYAKYYTSGKDEEGFTIDHFCGYKNGIYITISNGDFGPTAEISNEAPKCYSCEALNEEIPYFNSGTGLKIGQNKKTVSSILGYEISENITSILFEEIEKGKKHNISHTQTLRIEFRDNILFRFSIGEYRERYD